MGRLREMQREQARRAITQFAFSEGLLRRIATHLTDGLAAVDSAHAATRQALTLVTRWPYESYGEKGREIVQGEPEGGNKPPSFS